MRHTKRFLSFILSVIMVMTLAMPVMATEDSTPTTYKLTINNETEGHIYEAYQIFSGELAEKDGKQILSNIEWGSTIVKTGEDGYDKASELLVAINNESGLTALHGATDAASLAVKLSAVTSDSETLDLFAEVVGIILNGDKKSEVAGTSTYADKKYTISNLSAGYYLIKDKDDSLQGENDVYTKYIIRVLKSLEVTPKGDVPKVEKTINDTVDGTFTNIEDFDINDTAYYKWEGTLPSNLSSYETYTYKFTDILPIGLEFLQFEQIYIEGHDGNRIHTFLDLKDADTNNDILPTEIKETTQDENGEKLESITLEFIDLKTLYPSILPTHKIIVKYSARVTRDALIAEPMTNKVYAEFSNNPNGEGTGKTPEDVAHAFTFQINVDKYDADNKETKLEGAEFVLYYERTENDATVKYYAQVVTEEMIEAEEIINGTKVDNDDLGVVYGWDTDKTKASVLDTDQNGHLGVKGLDEGIYYLEETKAPTGYNLMETPVQIKIAPTYTETGETASVTVSYEVDSIAQSSSTVGVRNSSGSTLPVTGGMGTTLFYAVGGVLFLGGVVLLITKKRMSNQR